MLAPAAKATRRGVDAAGHPAFHVAACMPDCVHCHVDFRKQHFIARAAAEIVINGGCKLFLMRENRLQQTREIRPPLHRRRIGRSCESRSLIGEKIGERACFGDDRAAHFS